MEDTTYRTFTKYNVIRNNFFHLEGCLLKRFRSFPAYGPDSNGLWGNRNFSLYDGYDSDGIFNLIEGNRFGRLALRETTMGATA